MKCLSAAGKQMGERSRSDYVLFRTLPKLPTEVGKWLRQRAIGGSSRGMLQGLFSGTKPVYVDPGFATNRVQFRRDRSGESRLCRVLWDEIHLV